MLVVLFICLTTLSYGQLPTGFVINKLTGNTLNEAVSMGHAPDGRIFIAERSGNLKVYQNGTVTTIHTVQTTTAVEQGLLGLVLHSDFANNGKLYLYYTNTASTLHYLDVLVISATNTVTTVNRVMEFDPIINGFHNGGAMVFKGIHLYICIGESSDPAQSIMLNTYRGKVLRLLEDGQPAPGNPYYDEVGANRQKRSLWAIGMRNPWYMSMDPITQKVYVVNVGGDYEEIDDVTAPDATKGYNYGWASDGRSGPQQPNTTIHATYSYGHPGWGCAITSGVAFHPVGGATTYPPAYQNRFYFTDWCSGWIRSFDMSNPAAAYQEFTPNGFGDILALSVGIDGNIYYFKYGANGSLNRLEYTLPTVPVIVNHPESQTVVISDPVTFSVTASGAAPLTYQWYKNDVVIDLATSSTYTIPVTDANSAGTYHCVVSNNFTSVTSDDAVLTMLPFNARPVPQIITPASTLTWDVADVINFSGSATDAEDGTLPASAYSWEVQLHHQDCPTCGHWHPGPAVSSGVTSGSFTADNGGETSSNIWARLILTVTDSQGRTGKDSVDLHPNKVQITLQTNRTGLQIAMGGSSVAPYTKTDVVNSARTLSATSPQLVGDSLFTFVSWNVIGGAATQTIRIPDVNTTYKAIYSSAYIGQRPYGGILHPVPGQVEAEDYDLGGEGVAYHDNTVNNQGNQYRTTEGVDVENCNEGGYNIGYINNGEWLEYSLDVLQTGIYTITLRVSSPNTNRSAHLSIDEETVTGSLIIPNTGGYQNWQNLVVPNIFLEAGTRILRLSPDSDAFNLNFIHFALNTVTGTNSPATTYTLFEAYPNPVENILELKARVTIDAPLSLLVFDSRGQCVETLNLNGLSDVAVEKIDLSSMASGIYVVRIISEQTTQTLKVIKK
jgi:glucose/arabinose dehydrogenase